MNKRDANKQALENTRTVADLRAMVANARGRGGMSKVNPQFTLEQTCDIYAAALKDRKDDEVPAGMRRDVYSRTERMKPSRDSLMISNILRDCS